MRQTQPVIGTDGVWNSLIMIIMSQLQRNEIIVFFVVEIDSIQTIAPFKLYCAAFISAFKIGR